MTVTAISESSSMELFPLEGPTLPDRVDDITKYVCVEIVSDAEPQEIVAGGTADVLWGLYLRPNEKRIKVAVKRIRVQAIDMIDPQRSERLSRKTFRELEIWRSLGQGEHIIPLLGVTMTFGNLPSPVSERCTWNLHSYLKEQRNPPPKHIRMMIDTLRGLRYMHEMKPNPISHGDLKPCNILVTQDERAKLCDFGHSRLPLDKPQKQTTTSPFMATLLYTSPEIYSGVIEGPTPGSDMWAYGCVTLQILCRLDPYHEAQNGIQVMNLIQNGHLPSQRPRGPRASLINDSLWNALKACWSPEQKRPTSREFLDRLSEMLRSGEVSSSPVFLDLFPIKVDGPLLSWPTGLRDLAGLISREPRSRPLSSSTRGILWMGALQTTPGSFSTTSVVIKIPHSSMGSKYEPAHAELQHVLRKAMNRIFEIKHSNIIDIIGIDSSVPPLGIILEYCNGGDLVVYCTTHHIDVNTTIRPSSTLANAYSIILDIVEGLRYMHSFPVPVPQGDLVPENIQISGAGVAKINLLSFGRLALEFPNLDIGETLKGPILPFRWMSPELIEKNIKPTPESDMWAAACVSFWILTGVRPYAAHLRDDQAGLRNVQGIPPAKISHIDRAKSLGGRHQVSRGSSWITNGLWSAIARCWTLDPLLRPSANNFLRVLKGLEGRAENWLPENVKDLAGKVRVVDWDSQKTWMDRYNTFWKEFFGPKHHEKHDVYMNLYKSTYDSGWFSKTVLVTVKQAEAQYHSEPAMRHFKVESYVPVIRQEVMVTAQINHPNICKLLGIDSSYPKIPSLIFEYCSDVTLERFLFQKKPAFRDGLRIVRNVAAALEYIHSHPNGAIVHGNICPPNVFISGGGAAQLSNFTTACQYAANDASGTTLSTSVISASWEHGRWKSPEYHKIKDPEYIPRPTVPSDIWSLGCLSMNIFTKAVPFEGISDITVLNRIDQGIPPFTTEDYSALDSMFMSTIERMLSLDPEARPIATEVLRVTSQLV